MIKVCYLDCNDVEKEVGQAKDISEMWSIISKYLKEKDFVSYNNRVMGRTDDSIMIDFGSHTEFFLCYRKGLTAEIFKGVK